MPHADHSISFLDLEPFLRFMLASCNLSLRWAEVLALFCFVNGVVLIPNLTRSTLRDVRPNTNSNGTSFVDACLEVFKANVSAATNLPQLR